jgi:hypothetical protein
MNAGKEKINYYDINTSLKELGYSATKFWAFMGIGNGSKHCLATNLKKYSKTEALRQEAIDKYYIFLSSHKPRFNDRRFLDEKKSSDRILIKNERENNMRKFNSWVNDYNSMQKQEVKPTRYYKI